jgi:hypothetical protein
MNMEKREKFEGTEMADIMWSMVEATHYEGGVITGRVYWEDCLEFADKLHRMGYRRVAEPENTNIIKGEIV